MVYQGTVATSWPFRSSMRCLCLHGSGLVFGLLLCDDLRQRVLPWPLSSEMFGLYRDETDNLLPTALDEQCAYSR